MHISPDLSISGCGTQVPQLQQWWRERTERQALVALYESTGGPNWKNNTNWQGKAQTSGLKSLTAWSNAPSICSWYGVTCTGGHVTKLDLHNNDLSGPIPPEIGQLSSLQKLDMGIEPYKIILYSRAADQFLNRLTSLPPQIGQLSNLRTLNLCSNDLASLPPEIGQLSNLQELGLGSNQLTNLPPEIGQLSNLQELVLYSNQLTNLPPEIGQLSNLQELVLYNNQLTSLPPEIGQLSNLEWLELSGNQLTSLPPEIGQLSNLRKLYLSYDILFGLQLPGNPLTTLPPEVCQLDAYIDLRDQLCP